MRVTMPCPPHGRSRSTLWCPDSRAGMSRSRHRRQRLRKFLPPEQRRLSKILRNRRAALASAAERALAHDDVMAAGHAQSDAALMEGQNNFTMSGKAGGLWNDPPLGAVPPRFRCRDFVYGRRPNPAGTARGGI